MGRMGKIVSTKPVATLIVILIITSILGFYAFQIHMSADMSSFLPNDKVAKAQEKVSNEFGDTDIMEIVFVSNNTVSKSSLMDMLDVEKALVENKTVKDNLKTPDSPSQSLMSPADAIVMGNITLEFEKNLIVELKNITENMNKTNFTPVIRSFHLMNEVMNYYRDIYTNATETAHDAQNVVLLLFLKPSNSSNPEMGEFIPLMQNISAVLIHGENFEIKSKVLTMLTPPPMESNVSNMSNPLFNLLEKDMNSSMAIQSKEISVHYFIKLNNFSTTSLNYTNSSLTSGINGTERMINTLNYVNQSINTGNNNTALNTLNSTIQNLTFQLSEMKAAMPYYSAYNKSLSQFLYDLHNGHISPGDLQSVEKNTSVMLSIATGEFKNMLEIFNNTFNAWLANSHIYYDVGSEANTTQQICAGFVNNYNYTVQMNTTVTNIKEMIENNETVQNTSYVITTMSKQLNNSLVETEQQKSEIEKTIAMMQTPYFTWMDDMLKDLDYVLQNSTVAQYAVNVFNTITGMMNDSGAGSLPAGEMQVFYALKNVFDSGVSNSYKFKLQNMFLDEVSLMSTPHSSTISIPEYGNKMGINLPNLNPTVDEKKSILKNMTQSEIKDTLKNIENYNSAPMQDAINDSLPVLKNTDTNMSMIKGQLNAMLANIHFVYQTTGNGNVRNASLLYGEMAKTLNNASLGVDKLLKYIPNFSGFSYMMTQLSGELTNMFSNDFNGEAARASLMLVMLNSTRLLGESDTEHSNRMENMESVVGYVATHSGVNIKMKFMGTYLISQATEKTSNETMSVLLPVAMVLVVIILLITFRNLLDTLLGIFGLGMAIIWAYGFGVIAGYQFNQISTMVAVLLVGLGIDYAIHTTLRYREELRKGYGVRDAMREMITNLGMGLILATITTMVAFLSDLSSPIPPIQDFGMMNAVGIFGAFIIFTTAIPAIKLIVDLHHEEKLLQKMRKINKKREGSGVIVLNKFMSVSALAAERHRYAVLILVLVITGAAAYAGTSVSTTFDLKDFLPSNLEVSHTINFMMDNFNTSGMNNNYILIEGNVSSPKALEAVKKTMNDLKGDQYVDYTQSKSITTMIEEWSEKNSTFAKMVKDNDTNGDGLPNHNITAIYNWLYYNASGKSILHMSNGTYNSMLIIISSSASSNTENRVLTNEINKDMTPLKNAGLYATLTGSNILTFHILNMLEGSQWNSLVITIVVSLIVLTIVFYYEARSYILGLITSLPVLIALLWLLGSMYFLGINFNVVTVTVTSLTIGLGITYSIHITHRFLEDMKNEKRIENAVRKTVRHTGTSIFGAAATTMAGFGTLILSTMPPISQFGEISTLSILYSFVLSVFVLPSMLYVWAERRERK